MFYKLAGLAALACSCGVSAQTASPTETDATKTVANAPLVTVITPGRVLHKEDPKYPKEARKQNLQGQVLLQVTVEENGAVSRAAALSGEGALAISAVNAVSKWRFQPFTQDGHPLRVQQNLVFNFDPSSKVAELQLPLADPTPAKLPSVSGVFRVGGGVSPPRALYSPNPEYSDEARRAKYEGVCVLSLVVGPDGLPRDIRVARSLGMGLDEKAIEAVKQWRFNPALKDGRPVAAAINIEVNFRL